MTRQELIDALGAEFMLRTHPRREWLIEQIMILVDAYAASYANQALAIAREFREAAGGRDLQLPRLRPGSDR